jgi:hypothetical protein
MPVQDMISVYRKTSTQSGGVVTDSWTKMSDGDIEAFIYPLSQSESLRKYGIAVNNNWIAYIEPRDITLKDRIYYGVHIFEIKGLVDIGNEGIKYELSLSEVTK